MQLAYVAKLTDHKQLASIGRMIGRAFLVDPQFTAQFPDPVDRLRHTTELYIGDLRNCLQYGSVWVAQGQDGTPVGAITLLDMPKRVATTAGDEPNQSQPGGIWTELIDQFDPHEAECLRIIDDTQTGPWRYISVLAVAPEHQGTGIGADLLDHTIAIADREGIALGILTEVLRTVRYYQRFGFHIIEEGSETRPVQFWVLLRPASESAIGR
jgi:GNAT superfamily N-acetyltransferase